MDEAGLLSPQAEKGLDQKLKALETETSDQVVVVTVNSLNEQDIADFSLALANRWGIGQSGKVRDAYGHLHKDNGVILLVAPQEKRVRIEVGRGLEKIISNEKADAILQVDVLPLFQQNQYENGILSGSNAIIETLRENHAMARDYKETRL
ncbi:YgcG family protein [Asticcacaulis sp. YBE204]|uniref:TPM domain-containing protein n=1 Tax=Asticcacaulis sp. YBE204 TaxID=1282363 RepID=UPI0003C3B9B1|nr:TPM domain-containing protein [Asticcacaulis sp. YBE204]ESQ79873.1 hypothetical protein AEYBE204_08485 [Asticcacaulis sp. YBE204]